MSKGFHNRSKTEVEVMHVNNKNHNAHPNYERLVQNTPAPVS